MSDFENLSHQELYKRMFDFREAQSRKPIPLEVFQASALCKEVRRRAKTDLFFLSKYFIGYGLNENELMLERVHKRVCDLFVKKNCALPIGEQDTRKERLLLYPRGSFKSTIDGFDVVSWILNFPNVRILFLTAAKELAIGFLDEVKSYFLIRLGDQSFMNLFFPEFCVDEKSLGTAFAFTTPMRTIGSREPTVMASSIESTLSGYHFDVIKADDMVSNRNSETDEQLAKVYKNFQINRKMLMPYGYVDLIGTRYADADTYGVLMEKNVGDIEKTLGICWEKYDNRTSGFQILIGRAVVPKAEFAEKNWWELEETQCDLLFPEYLNFSKLMKEYHFDELACEGQYNQNPRALAVTTFDRPLLLRHTVPFMELPLQGPVSITWDFAFSKKKGRDYSTASVAIYNEKGKLFIIDLVRARYKPMELAQAVVELAKKWRPIVIGIEDCAGSRFLEPTIISEAKKCNLPDVLDVCRRIDWFAPDQQKDAKKTRMAALHPWLINDMLYFAAGLPHLETLYKEFELCLTAHHHDDIPDVISQQPRYAPQMQLMIEKHELITMSREDAAWNLMFEPGTDPHGRIGMGGYVQKITPDAETEDTGLEAVSPDGILQPMLGAGLCG